MDQYCMCFASESPAFRCTLIVTLGSKPYRRFWNDNNALAVPALCTSRIQIKISENDSLAFLSFFRTGDKDLTDFTLESVPPILEKVEDCEPEEEEADNAMDIVSK